MMMRSEALLLAPALLLVGCGPPGEGAQREQGRSPQLKGSAEAPLTVPAPAAAKAAAPQPPKLVRHAPKLGLLSHADFSGRIEPGLGCSFAEVGSTSPLVVATAPLDSAARPKAVAKVDGRLHLLQTAKRGGYRALEAGPVLADRQLSVRLVRSAGSGTPDGPETQAWPATLIVELTGAPAARFQGRWSCGA